MKKESVLVVFSGGQDSTTCMGWAKSNFNNVFSVTFDYGQKHRIEILQAKKIAKKLNIENVLLDVNAFSQLNDSALVDSSLDMSSSHSKHKNLPASFVPNRNAILFTLAHAYAQKIGVEHIVIGVNQSDYSGYPDCREDFVLSLENTLNIGSDCNIKFHYPLINLSKAQTFALAKEHNVLSLVIDKSHTCYNGNHTDKYDWGYGCNNCPACLLRARGYKEYLNL